ncbi:MAG: FAD-binding protein [Eubacterium sp.]|nr:FAD-binding protein [Eubacterium sp.]
MRIRYDKVRGELISVIKDKIEKKYRVRIRDIKILKKSIDARKKPEIFYQINASFSCDNEPELLKRKRELSAYKENKLVDEFIRDHKGKYEKNILIIGAGPAGVMCAYFLAKCGYKPIIVERGSDVDKRVEAVNRFWQEGKLDPDTNVSFGEGGAGTFSDGKLNTNIKDKTGKNQWVLRVFVENGAPEEILYQAKPHIGTDNLRFVMKNIREKIEAMGGEYMFNTKMTGFCVEDNRITGVEVAYSDGSTDRIPAESVVLAIGHSARDTFEYISQTRIPMERKPFAMGVRVQHLQSHIDKSQYGVTDSGLPPADYKLTGKTSDGRGVYSFCMCPGGYVVNASSENGRLVVNGMSDFKRDSGFANSAILVSVEPEDFGDEENVLAGMELQRSIEKNAFELADGKIPVQRFGDFKVEGSGDKVSPIVPCVKGKYSYADVRKALPSFIANGIIEGMEQFGHKINGFDDDDTLVIGTETRSSSPVRIIRDENLVSPAAKGLYPCGEGAGYAGGIMSAAMDGIRVAMQIVLSI